MQDIFDIQIEVIDTYDTVSTTPVYAVEFAEKNSLRYRGEGGEDKRFMLYKTSLQFSFEVSDRSDAKYKALNTGDEQRYLVRLSDNYGVVHWTGFLLPDQGAEPYQTGVFYVNFTATDGLQSLNGKFLDASFYNDVKTLPQLLGACLAQTGQTLPVAIAPGVINAYAQNDYTKLLADTFEWSGDAELSALEILEKVLSTLDAFVVQYRQRWYVLGHNLMGEQFINCKIYGLDGVFIQDHVLGRPIRTIIFENPAEVNTVPPYKRVTVTGDGEFNNELVDQRLIDAPYYQVKRGLLQPADPVGFIKVGSVTNSNATYLDYDPPVNASGQRNEKILHNKVTASQLQGEYDEATALSNYHQLDQFAYLSPADGLLKIELIIDVFCNLPQNPKQLLEDGFYDTALRFEFYLNNKLLISNFRQNPGSILVENKFQLDDSNDLAVRLRSEQFIPNVNISESGYLSFRIYLSEQIDRSQTRVSSNQIDTLSIELINKRSLKQVVTRPVPFTKVFEKAIGFYPLQSSQVTSQLYVADAIPAGENDIILHVAGTEDGRDVGYIAFEDYFKIIEYKDYLYYQTTGNDPLVKIDFEDINIDTYYIDKGAGELPHEIYFYFPDLSVPFTYGSSLLRIVNTNEFLKKQSQSLVQAREQWHKVAADNGTPRSLAKCIAESWMDRYAVPQYTFEGRAFEIYNPLDIIKMNYDGERSFIPLRVDNDLNSGECDIYMIENKIESQQDYAYSN